MLSPLPMPLPVLRLIPGTDTTDTATGHTAMDTMATDLMDMDTTMERGLLMLSPLLMLLPVLRPRLIPGTDTTMVRGLLMLSPLLMLLPVLRLRPILGTDTTVTATGVKLRPTTTSCFSLPTLL